MTFLSVCRDQVAPAVSIELPDAVFGSTARDQIELVAIGKAAVLHILKCHEWQALKSIATYTGNGSIVDFSMPTNYDRMLTKANLWSSSLATAFRHIADDDEWLGLDVQAFQHVINAWIIYGGQIHIKPAMATGITAKHFYIRNTIVTASDASVKAQFTADTDVFGLDEFLLGLCMIWKWKAKKGAPYAEDLSNFEEYKDQLIVKDKGSNILRVGERRIPSGVRIAYPVTITP